MQRLRPNNRGAVPNTCIISKNYRGSCNIYDLLSARRSAPVEIWRVATTSLRQTRTSSPRITSLRSRKTERRKKWNDTVNCIITEWTRSSWRREFKRGAHGKTSDHAYRRYRPAINRYRGTVIIRRGDIFRSRFCSEGMRLFLRRFDVPTPLELFTVRDFAESADSTMAAARTLATFCRHSFWNVCTVAAYEYAESDGWRVFLLRA